MNAYGLNVVNGLAKLTAEILDKFWTSVAPLVPGRTCSEVWAPVVVLIHFELSNAPVPMYCALVKSNTTGLACANASFWAIKALLKAASPM